MRCILELEIKIESLLTSKINLKNRKEKSFRRISQNSDKPYKNLFLTIFQCCLQQSEGDWL
jgi:hypothetical protein